MLGRVFSIGIGASVVASVLLTAATVAASTVRVGGTGAGLAAVQRMGELFVAAHPGIQVQVLPSLGTPGGLKALGERAIDVAIAGRSLKPAERAAGASEALCVTTALVFASSHAAPPGIATADLPGLFSDPRPTWPDGSPLKPILRSRAGSEVPYLAAAVPGLGPAFDAAYKRPGMPIGATDQENAELAVKVAGSFAITTLLQIRAERLNLRVLPLDGVVPSAATIADKSYPFAMPICLVLPAAPSADAKAFVDYVGSPASAALLRSLDTITAD